MISENYLEGWRHLYDRYGAIMYGVICKFTDDTVVAEDIFTKTFIQLKQMDIPATWIPSLSSRLVRHAHTVARQELKKRNILYPKDVMEETSILFILSSEHINIKEVAANCGMTEEDARIKLRLELTAFHFSCLKQKQPVLPYSIVKDSKSVVWSYGGTPSDSM